MQEPFHKVLELKPNIRKKSKSDFWLVEQKITWLCDQVDDAYQGARLGWVWNVHDQFLRVGQEKKRASGQCEDSSDPEGKGIGGLTPTVIVISVCYRVVSNTFWEIFFSKFQLFKYKWRNKCTCFGFFMLKSSVKNNFGSCFIDDSHVTHSIVKKSDLAGRGGWGARKQWGGKISNDLDIVLFHLSYTILLRRQPTCYLVDGRSQALPCLTCLIVPQKKWKISSEEP